jgi:phosphatidate cytidylyltransferase
VAFNFQTFKTRALTALLFVAVMLTGLLWDFWSFLILFTIIHFGCWFEYLRLVEKIYSIKIDIVIKWFFAICGFTLMFVVGVQHIYYDVSMAIGDFYVSFKLLFWLLLFICLIAFLFQNRQIPEKAKWMSLGGLIYISLALGFMLSLRREGLGISCMNGGGVTGEANTIYDHFILPFVIIPLTIISSIWINDTMAYIVGSFIGKTPLSKISPKKTWEGTLGGIVLSILTTGLLFSNLNPEIFIRDFKYDFANYHFYVIAGICAIFGTLGDLFESKLKRMADVKDSGNFMPGHGGFLDRFDSLLFAVPAVWAYVYFFIK